MNFLIAKVTPGLRAELVKQGPQAIRALFARTPRPGFNPGTDLLADCDYRDLTEWAENPDHPAARMFDPYALVEGSDSTHGAPLYFGPQEVAALHAELAASDDWVFDEITSFIEQAVRERKGLIVGVA